MKKPTRKRGKWAFPVKKTHVARPAAPEGLPELRTMLDFIRQMEVELPEFKERLKKRDRYIEAIVSSGVNIAQHGAIVVDLFMQKGKFENTQWKRTAFQRYAIKFGA